MSRKILTAEEIYESSEVLANDSEISFLGTIDEEGYPHIKALMKAKNNSLEEIWMSTGTSSEKTKQLENNSKTCVYFVNFEKFAGLMLLGETIPKRDSESRNLIWSEGDEQYYPQGVEDPNYTVFHFTAKIGRYYFRRRWPTFKIPSKKKQ